MSDVVLSKGVRSNLLNLQKTADSISMTQGRLATGKKVNSALDNPTNFFTASSLTSRASDLSNLLDGLSNGIKTLEAADNGLKSITKTVESMQSTLRQARQDKSFKGQSFTLGSSPTGNLSFSGGAVGTTAVTVSLDPSAAVATTLNGASGTFGTYTGGAIDIDGTSVTIADDSNLAAVQSAIDGALGAGYTVGTSSGQLTLSKADGTDIAITGDSTLLTTIGFASGNRESTNGTEAGGAKTVDSLVSEINANSGLTDKVRASNDGGRLRIENLSTESLSVVGASATAVTGGTGASNTQSIGGNEVRKNLISQFNELRTQLDKLSDDASFNGINLLRGDKLSLNFNETGTSKLDIQGKNAQGVVRGISTADNSLDIDAVDADVMQSDSNIDDRLAKLGDALTQLRTQSSSFGSNLSVVQNRQEFTKATINTLTTGADNLTLADMNEEAANLLSLQTRQQLSNTALSLANQADQGVLRLF